MRSCYDIILKPIITEASMDMAQNKKYVFKVLKTATKSEIAAAIEEAFKVEVADVNTINVKSKPKRRGMIEGRTAEWKKAIVTLTEKSGTIEFFDGMM